ncbi:MAG: hypothetical protein QW594_00445 [Candidatus Woesearchaeota archaeon]
MKNKNKSKESDKGGVGKQIFFAIMVFAVVLALPLVLVYAEDTEPQVIGVGAVMYESSQTSMTPEEVTQEVAETTMFVYPYGAQVRLLQLQKAIKKNIIAGQEIVSQIQQQTPTADITKMQELLQKMEGVLEKTQQQLNEIQQQADPIKESKTLALAYVELKNEAKTLTHEFRQLAQQYAKDIDGIKLKIKEKQQRHQEELKQYDQKIKEKKQQYYSNQIQHYEAILQKKDSTLAKQVEEGQLTVEEAWEQLRQQWKILDNNQKQQARIRLNEEHAKQQIHQIAIKSRVEMMKNSKMKNEGQIPARLTGQEQKNIRTQARQGE